MQPCIAHQAVPSYQRAPRGQMAGERRKEEEHDTQRPATKHRKERRGARSRSSPAAHTEFTTHVAARTLLNAQRLLPRHWRFENSSNPPPRRAPSHTSLPAVCLPRATDGRRRKGLNTQTPRAAMRKTEHPRDPADVRRHAGRLEGSAWRPAARGGRRRRSRRVPVGLGRRQAAGRAAHHLAGAVHAPVHGGDAAEVNHAHVALRGVQGGYRTCTRAPWIFRLPEALWRRRRRSCAPLALGGLCLLLFRALIPPDRPAARAPHACRVLARPPPGQARRSSAQRGAASP